MFRQFDDLTGVGVTDIWIGISGITKLLNQTAGPYFIGLLIMADLFLLCAISIPL